MLAIPGMDWTDQRLQVAANALSNVSANAYTKASIERLLRQELQVASVFLLQPAIRSVDLRQWGVREAAYVLAKRLAYTYSSHLFEESDTRLRFSSIEVALIDSLDEALQEFVDELEPQALKLASASGQLNQRLYNYLTHKSHRQFRVQLAETFPSLLVTSALAKRDTLGAELRSIVDSGTPLIKGLAGRWKVRPGVVRHLVGKPTGHVGIQWSRDAMGLAQALNALRPEDVPGDEADTWREFNHMVAVGQRLFCRPIWDSAAGLEWLKECVSRANRGTKRELERWLPSWAEVTSIVRFRNALTKSLKRDLADVDPRPVGNVADAVVEAVDWLFLKKADGELGEAAMLFSDELDRIDRASAIRKIALGTVMMPLIPGDFVSADGARRIRPLITDIQLRLHGHKVRNCLRYRSATRAIRSGAIGTVFIVGILDANTSIALSTAELRVTSNAKSHAYRVTVKQHTGKANRQPSKRCLNAIRELLRHCQTDEVREHLQANRAELRYLRGKDRRAHAAAQHTKHADAFRRVLTDEVYDELIARAREQRAVVDDAVPGMAL